MTTAPQVITIFRSLAAKRFALFFGTISERIAINLAFAEALHQLRQGVPMSPLVEQGPVEGTSEEMAVGARIAEQLRRSNLRIVANMNLAAAAAAKAREIAARARPSAQF